MSMETWLDTIDGTPNVCVYWGGRTTRPQPPTVTVRTNLPAPPFTRSQWDDNAGQWVDVTPVSPVKVGSWEIRDALTREERKSIRSSTSDDVVEAYEDVLTMGDYRIRRDDPRLSGFLTLVRSVHPEHTYNGLAELIGAEVL